MIQRPENIVKIESGEPSELYDAERQRFERFVDDWQTTVDEIFAAGYVVTIELVPQKPLAMGNYKPVVSVRERRK